jgi:hypothetical protein
VAAQVRAGSPAKEKLYGRRWEFTTRKAIPAAAGLGNPDDSECAKKFSDRYLRFAMGRHRNRADIAARAGKHGQGNFRFQIWNLKMGRISSFRSEICDESICALTRVPVDPGRRACEHVWGGVKIRSAFLFAQQLR